MMTIYKAVEWYSKVSSDKFTCVIKTWTDQDFELLFVKQIEEKANLKKKKNVTLSILVFIPA